MNTESYARWREDQLSKEIAGLDARIAEVSNPPNPRARCVQSYLRVLLRAKRDKLATLRYQKTRAS